MPEKIKRVAIGLEGQKEVYRPGEVLKGFWELTSEKEFATKGIICTFQGVSFVKWTESKFGSRHDDEFISYEVYCKETKQLYGQGDTKDTIKPGVYKYPFSFVIPNKQIPSSFEGSKGAIRYFIEICIRRPIPYPNVTRYKCITVLEEIDVNKETYKSPLGYKKDCQVPKALWLGNSGTVDLWGRIDRRAYCPGEKIALSVIAKNNSTQKLGKVKAQIMQYVTFTGNGTERSVTNTIKVLQGKTELEPGKVFKWTNLLMLLDGVPPTIERPSCHCIRVKYYLEVVVPVPFFTGSDLKLYFPITIGTVPYGKSLNAKPIQSDGIQVYDASKAITYTNCNKGWSAFNEYSDSRNFPMLTYTPMCAYAVNYVFQEHPPAQKSSVRQTTNTASSRSAHSSQVPSAPPAEAAPLPSKVPLPETGASVFPDSASTASGQEENLLPPSYEEATGVQDAGADEDSDEEECDVLYMILRMEKPLLEEMVNSVRNNKGCLEEQKGRFLFKTTKAYNFTGTWPKDKVIAMLSFPSKKNATDWLSTPGIKRSNWLSAADIILTGVKEQYQTEKHFVMLSELSTLDENEEAVTRYRKLMNDICRPLRILHGGLLCFSGSEYEVLQGTWKSRFDSKISFMSWPNVQAMKKYRESISDVQQTINELKEKCMVIHNTRSFEVEEVSMETIPEDDSSHDSS